MQSIRIDRNTAATMLGVSVSTLKRRCNSDPKFPQPIKDGATRAAHVYFLKAEIEEYIQKQFESRDEKIAA